MLDDGGRTQVLMGAHNFFFMGVQPSMSRGGFNWNYVKVWASDGQNMFARIGLQGDRRK